MTASQQCRAEGNAGNGTSTINGKTYLLPPPPPNDPRAIIDNQVETDDPYYAQPAIEGSAPAPTSSASIGGSRCTGDQILVKFKAGTFANSYDNMLAAYRARRLSHRRTSDWHLVSVPAWLDVSAFKAFLEKEPLVDKVEYNWIASLGSVPGDNYYNTFNTFYRADNTTFSTHYQWSLHIINMEPAWSRTFGDPRITVAVCDTGVSTSHPDLNARIARNPDGSLRGYAMHGTPNAFYPFEDNVGHGTFVSGIIGAFTQFEAAPPNGYGIAGVCPLSPILPIQISHEPFGGTSKPGDASEEDEANGIAIALTQPDVKVINISYQGNRPLAGLEDAVISAHNRGVLLVTITGNLNGINSSLPVYPDAYDGAMNVGASDITNSSASYSNEGNNISVTAPGGDRFNVPNRKYQAFADCQVCSTTLNNSHAFDAGTSFAAPHVAGVGALLFARFPTMQGWDVQGRMEDTAVDVNAATRPGYDTQMGWGLINADSATRLEALFTTSFPATSVARPLSLPFWSDGLDVADKTSDPARLFPNTGATVLWWDPAAGLYRQYASYMAPRLGAGRGYFVNFPSAMQNVTYTGAYAFRNPAHRVTVHLLAGWNLISAPGVNPTTWNKQNILVKRAKMGSPITLAQAAAGTMPWTLDYAVHYNYQTQQNEMVDDTPGTLHQLVAPEAYWFKSNYELDLLLPGS